MSGSLAVRPDGPPDPHDHIVFETDAGVRVTYHDPRRFGSLHLTTAAALPGHPLFAHLGPEPLDDAFDGPALAARLAGKRCTIKAALLDQRVVAGLGNIYVCESLFHAGLSPRRLAGTVTGVRAARLVEAIRRVLLAALESGGSTLRDHRQPNGELGYFQHAFSVYGKEGEPCPGCDCDTARTGGIGRIVQTGRSTFFCARRQR
jgi:formamidopyrimidine-DNA glycosylase